jgi:hypothetical protein
MHILEAALAANLRLSPRNRAVANTGVWPGRTHPIGRLAAAAAAIGLFVLTLNGASIDASPREAASAAETKGP